MVGIKISLKKLDIAVENIKSNAMFNMGTSK